jgi:predicted Fe-Mo cluster-binding NifX family protein
MKVVITSQEKGLDSKLDTRFGRAAFLLLVDTDTEQCTAFDNSVNLNSSNGAGIQSAKRVERLGVEAVITGHVGPKAFRALNKLGVKVYLADSGKVSKALDLFRDGKLEQVDAPDVGGGWK